MTSKSGRMICVTTAVLWRFELINRFMNIAENCEQNRLKPDKRAVQKEKGLLFILYYYMNKTNKCSRLS